MSHNNRKKIGSGSYGIVILQKYLLTTLFFVLLGSQATDRIGRLSQVFHDQPFLQPQRLLRLSKESNSDCSHDQDCPRRGSPHLLRLHLSLPRQEVQASQKPEVRLRLRLCSLRRKLAGLELYPDGPGAGRDFRPRALETGRHPAQERHRQRREDAPAAGVPSKTEDSTDPRENGQGQFEL